MARALKNAIGQLAPGKWPLGVGTAVMERSDAFLGSNDDNGGSRVFEAERPVDRDLIYSNVDVRHTSCAISQDQVRRGNDRAVHYIHPGGARDVRVTTREDAQRKACVRSGRDKSVCPQPRSCKSSPALRLRERIPALAT